MGYFRFFRISRLWAAWALLVASAAAEECQLLNAFGSSTFSNTAFLFGVYSTQDLLLTSLSVSFSTVFSGGITTWNGTGYDRFGAVSFKPAPLDFSPEFLNSGFSVVKLNTSRPRDHTLGLPTLTFAEPILLRARQASTIYIHSGDGQRSIRYTAVPHYKGVLQADWQSVTDGTLRILPGVSANIYAGRKISNGLARYFAGYITYCPVSSDRVPPAPPRTPPLSPNPPPVPRAPVSTPPPAPPPILQPIVDVDSTETTAFAGTLTVPAATWEELSAAASDLSVGTVIITNHMDFPGEIVVDRPLVVRGGPSGCSGDYDVYDYGGDYVGTRITPSVTPLSPKSRCTLDAHRRYTRHFNVISSGSLTLIDLALVNSGYPVALREASGGSVHLSAGSVGHEFVNCTFAACRGRQGGAIFAEEGVRLSILDSIFREGAAIEGGDVYGSEGSEVAISRSVFNSSYAILRGGSLFIAGSSVDGATGVQGLGNAGQVLTSVLRVSDSAFFGGGTTYTRHEGAYDVMVVRGGAVFTGQSVRLSVERTTFEGFNAQRGGAIYADAFSVTVLAATSITSCYAYVSGGAVATGASSVLALIDSALAGNEAVISGGAVFADVGAKVFALSSEGIESPAAAAAATGGAGDPPWAAAATAAGAGSGAPAGLCTAWDSTPSAPSAPSTPSAPSAPSALSAACAFSGNAASGALGSGGAVFLSTGAYFWFHGCCLTGNAAVSGGTIHSSGAWLQTNAAYAPDGILPISPSLLAPLGSDPAWLQFAFPAAIAGLAGDFEPATGSSSSDNNHASIVHWEVFGSASEVTGSSASGSGGALYCGAGAHCALSGSSIARSTAGTSGGGIFLSTGAAQLLLLSSQLTNNSAALLGGGVFCDGVSRAEAEGSLFEQNAAGMGGGALYSTDCSISLMDTALLRNSAVGAYPKGGCIYAFDGSQIRLARCRLEGNTVQIVAIASLTDRVLVEPLGSGQGGMAFLRSSAPLPPPPSPPAPPLPPRPPVALPPPLPPRPAPSGFSPRLPAAEVPAGRPPSRPPPPPRMTSVYDGGGFGTSPAAGPPRSLRAAVSLSIEGSLVQGGSAEAGGAIAAVGPVSVLLSGVSFRENNASRGGVAKLYQGASFAVSACEFVGNTAEIGSVAFFAGPAAQAEAAASQMAAWGVLRDNSASNYGPSLATEASAWLLAASSANFHSQRASPAFLTSLYDALAARPPASAADRPASSALDAAGTVVSNGTAAAAGWTTGGSVTLRTGSPFSVASFLVDGLGQHVNRADGDVSVACVGEIIADDVDTNTGAGVRAGAWAQCGPSRLRGTLRATYAQGGSTFAPISVFGRPLSVFRLAVSTPSIAAVSFLNVTVAPCATLEAFEPVSQLCVWRDVAGSQPRPGNATGCECRSAFVLTRRKGQGASSLQLTGGRVTSSDGTADQLACEMPAVSGEIAARELSIILGSTIGGSAGILLLLLVCVAVFVRKREAAKWRDETEARKLIISDLIARLSRADCEEDILADALGSLRQLYPGAVGYAVATFEDTASGSTRSQVALLRLHASSQGGKLALEQALQTKTASIPENIPRADTNLSQRARAAQQNNGPAQTRSAQRPILRMPSGNLEQAMLRWGQEPDSDGEGGSEIGISPRAESRRATGHFSAGSVASGRTGVSGGGFSRHGSGDGYLSGRSGTAGALTPTSCASGVTPMPTAPEEDEAAALASFAQPLEAHQLPKLASLPSALRTFVKSTSVLLDKQGSVAAAAAAAAAVAAEQQPGYASHQWAAEEGATVDSLDFAAGILAFTDWSAAATLGLKSSRAVTAPIRAGPVALGFVTLHFERSSEEVSTATLEELCNAVGGSLFVRRSLVGVGYHENPFGTTGWSERSYHGLPTVLSGRTGHYIKESRSKGLPHHPNSMRDRSRDREQSSKIFTDLTPEVSRTISSRNIHVQFKEQGPALSVDSEASAMLARDAEEMKAQLRRWDLDAWDLSEPDLCRLLLHMFYSVGLVKRFSLRPFVLMGFFEQVAEHYMDNPFHSFRHAFTVTHTAWRFLDLSADLSNKLADLDKLALLISALGHDLEHPGTTNAYQINLQTELAMLHNDRHVLENHHAYVCCRLLEETGIAGALAAEDKRMLRKLVVEAILGTDMACHKEMISKARRILAADSPQDRKDLFEERLLLVQILTHCADLHTPTLEPAVARRVAESLSLENEKQAELEKGAGLKVTVMLAANTQSKAAMEVSFIQFVVRPLWNTLGSLFPELKVFLLRVDKVLDMWDQLQQEEQQKQTASEQAAGGRRSNRPEPIPERQRKSVEKTDSPRSGPGLSLAHTLTGGRASVGRRSSMQLSSGDSGGGLQAGGSRMSQTGDAKRWSSNGELGRVVMPRPPAG